MLYTPESHLSQQIDELKGRWFGKCWPIPAPHDDRKARPDRAASRGSVSLTGCPPSHHRAFRWPPEMSRPNRKWQTQLTCRPRHTLKQCPIIMKLITILIWNRPQCPMVPSLFPPHQRPHKYAILQPAWFHPLASSTARTSTPLLEI